MEIKYSDEDLLRVRRQVQAKAEEIRVAGNIIERLCLKCKQWHGLLFRQSGSGMVLHPGASEGRWWDPGCSNPRCGVEPPVDKLGTEPGKKLKTEPKTEPKKRS